MNVLVLNCGSSSLKFQVLDPGSSAGIGRRPEPIARGLIEGIGGESVCTFAAVGGTAARETSPLANHEDAVRIVLDWLASTTVEGQPATLLSRIDAVGHRIVHGGARFHHSVLIDGQVLSAIESFNDLAPLHNPPALRAVRACQAALGPSFPMVAAFDTAFHQTLPDYASTYALPHDLAQRHGIRRYGFHGIAHRYAARRFAEITSTPCDLVSLVTLHLGNGCSASAIRQGKSVDTSMGFTPLEGLVMGTRSGDLDPAIVGFLAQKEGASIAEVEGWLNARSGLLGVSGRSNDMRDLLAHLQEDERARLAVELFCYRARKYVGAYFAALGGADAVVFSGGIGERSPLIRARICEGMHWCGLALDSARNDRLQGDEGSISPPDARVQVYVIPSDEELLIAQDTVRLLEQRS
jgi:acetate kinase